MGLLSSFKKALHEKSPRNPGEAGASIDAIPLECVSRRRRLLVLSSDSGTRQVLRQLLQTFQARWDIVFEATGLEALNVFQGEQIDAVLVESGDPTGAEAKVLSAIAQSHPRVLRFLRCSPEQKELAKRCGSPAPAVLMRDADADTIFSVIEQAFRLEEWMVEGGAKELIAKLPKLPSLPALYSQVMSELKSPGGSIEVVACLIAKDPIMTAKILQVVNSAFFSLPREICEPKEAVMFLGAERTKSLVLLAKVFSQFEEAKCPGFSLEATWRHSMATAGFAQRLCQSLKKEAKLAEAAFTAGLLHDVGKLLLAGNLPNQYGQLVSQASRRGVPVGQVEKEVFGTTHAEVGACLLGIWGLPLPILEAIAFHHRPGDSDDKAFSLLTAVHVANIFDHESHGVTVEQGYRPIDPEYLETIGVRDQRNPWRQACGLRCRPEENPLTEKIGKAQVKVA